MDQKESIDQLIDRYLSQKMDRQELAAFEERMTREPDFRKEVIFQKMIIDAVRKKELKKIFQNEEIRKGKILRTRIIFTMGTMLAAASLFTGFLYIENLNRCEALANRYYASYVNIYELPSRGEPAAIATPADSVFFAALKDIEKNNTKKAVAQLNQLQKVPGRLKAAPVDVVKWYLALAYLKDGKKKKAIELLKLISNEPNSDYSIKAKKLLTDLS